MGLTQNFDFAGDGRPCRTGKKDWLRGKKGNFSVKTERFSAKEENFSVKIGRFTAKEENFRVKVEHLDCAGKNRNFENLIHLPSKTF